MAALVKPPQQEDSYAAAYGTREVGAASAYARSWSAGADHESDAVRKEREATFNHEDELIAARADAAAAEDAAAEAVRMRSTPQTPDGAIPQTRSPRNVVHAGGKRAQWPQQTFRRSSSTRRRKARWPRRKKVRRQTMMGEDSEVEEGEEGEEERARAEKMKHWHTGAEN